MMMEKPRPKESQPQSSVSGAVGNLSVKKKKTPEEAVADLEARLAALGGGSTENIEADVIHSPPPSFTTISSSITPTVITKPSNHTSQEIKGGKNALLVSEHLY
jgi:hypothetical protein